eukprot:TRINITY_DN1388_c0_g1_i4.p2 TRINITY_DN1388_c0_g1~~TRINITY_DN1388_c0_g1_i4.p2  ORF type:complete len:137 (-),score=9.56 TRINITY_DN1388_c0_g1_i4:255-665(-)
MSGRSHPVGTGDIEDSLSQAEAISAVDDIFYGGLAAGGMGDEGLSDRTCVRAPVLWRCVGVGGDNLSEKSRVFVFVRKSFRCLLGDARSRKEIHRGVVLLHFPFVTYKRWLFGQYEERMATSRWKQTWVLDRRWHG